MSIPQVDANREVRIAIEDSAPSQGPSSSPKPRKNRRRNSREWLQQQRKRLTKSRSFGQIKTTKTKMALAHDEVINEGSHPIIMVEASTMSREGGSSCNGSSSHAPLLVGGERIYLTPSGSGISQARYQPGLPLLSPTPRRPNPNRFPFLNPATASVETTHSSNYSQANGGPEPGQEAYEAGAQHNEGNRADGEQNVAGSNNSLTQSAIIAVRRPARTNSEQCGHYGIVTSNSPSIYYLAPSSPQILPTKGKRVSSVPSEALEPFPALEDEHEDDDHEDDEEHDGEIQGDLVEDNPVEDDLVEDDPVEDSAVEDNAADDAEVQAGETQEDAVLQGSEEEQGCPLLEDTDSEDEQGCPLQADPELDSNFLSAVMAFVAASQPRPRSVSLTRDEQRSGILVHSSSSA